ncbi:hypothetical protein LOTGIDRAFT_156189 [Lottia gigantea]|uniref:Chitin-binding type-4 domain-containing protein n=1 Tax=Lottia gigantea TaxID=225164 RepID=V4BBK7_LOTGI|nr:hypothetical protein LOTGIDRAFT_156189 [Lottia gigantea]ESP04946.1 hypothetical protein LOTGIDRAFT_156189 [Lottia gigantea]
MLEYLVIMFAVGVGEVSGHGRMIEPPSRASMFRFGYNNPPDYNDNELNCGGFAVQQELGGKCGICGNPFNGTRHHEAGGRYANGIISGSYVSGQVIRVSIQITANHRGYFVFKVCPNNDVNRMATHECLDEYALELADGSGTKYYIDDRLGNYDIDLTLPEDLVCSQCVLQWMYRCGNNHGTAENGTSCLGCGPQEEFYACSDIEILASGGQPVSQTPVALVGRVVPLSIIGSGISLYVNKHGRFDYFVRYLSIRQDVLMANSLTQ